MKFRERLLRASKANRSLICVGLDFDMDRIPPDVRANDYPIIAFNQAIIEATRDIVNAYKPNVAFYERYAERGWTSLRKTIELIPEDVPVILDVKRGDIGSTAQAYADAYFEDLGADAVTVNPYLGTDSLQPFLNYEDRGVFVVCRTTNPSASEIQNLPVNGAPLYEHVARLATESWNQNDNIGLVAPGNDPSALHRIRKIAGPHIPLLVPGLGAQGGKVSTAVHNGANLQGNMLILNASRSVLYASQGADFAQAARKKVLQMRSEANDARNLSVAP